MSGASIILEIPVEILHTVFRVEKDDPLKPIMDVMKSNKMIESNSQSVHRLDALSRLSSSISKISEFPTPVMRDLWKGKYWKMGEKGLSLESDITGSIHQLEPIQRLDVNKSEGEVKDLAAPFLGWLAGKSQINRKDILSHVRLESLETFGETIFLRTKISQKEDRAGRKFWVYEEGPFKQLIGDYIDQVPGFEIDERNATEKMHEWPYSPEVMALRELRKKVKLSKISDAKLRGNENNLQLKKKSTKDQNVVLKEAKSILKSIMDQINEDMRPRLNEVKQIVGFRQDMWDAAQVVINSAERRVFVLTSFSNKKFLGDVADMLAEASERSSPEILLSFGEPDRGRSPEDIEKTNRYISTLSKDKRLNLKGGVSAIPTHSKIIVSDTGMIFLCSCNLFSGSFDSGVLESGLLIKDAECARTLIEAVDDERWVPETIKKQFGELFSRIKDTKDDKYGLFELGNKISEIKTNINKGEIWYAIPKLERMLLEISERPTWSLIRTLEHRPFMADCIKKFEDRLVMGSDGLRSNGLDKESISGIVKRASKKNATVQIWWGRHAPKSKSYDEADARGRKEAKNRLEQLRGHKGLFLIPRTSNEPMETHAKMFIVDDLRLMITSDNTLSFGDTETERGDAGELGIVVDHPRLAIQTRGCMELWLPDDAVVPRDNTKWWSLLGEEVGLQTDNPFQKVPLINALDSLIERVESNNFLKSRWEREVESSSNEIEILNKLTLGNKFGIYSIAESVNSAGNKSRLSEEQIEEAVISLAKKKRWNISIDDSIDNALISALSQYKSKSGTRPHFIMQGGRNYELSYKSKELHMQFDEDFVLPYLIKHREEVIDELNSLFGFEIEVSWSLTSSGKMMNDFSNEFSIEEEITPKIWAESLIQFMDDPDIFEFISDPYNRMVTSEPKLKLGKGELAIFVDEECYEFIEWKRRKGQLYVRRRRE